MHACRDQQDASAPAVQREVAVLYADYIRQLGEGHGLRAHKHVAQEVEGSCKGRG